MVYYVYMLLSKSIKPITYVGYTNNLKKRIILHNGNLTILKQENTG